MLSRTKRIRIAVAINSKGQWNAIGYHKWGDSESRETALEGLDSPGAEQIVWVEADVPIPEEPTIQGEAVASEGVT